MLTTKVNRQQTNLQINKSLIFVPNKVKQHTPLEFVSNSTTLVSVQKARNVISHIPAMQKDVMGNIQYSNATEVKTTSSHIHKTNQNLLTPKLPTPVNYKKLEYFLQGYDQEKSDYLVNGFKYGFDLRNIKFCPNDSDNNQRSANSQPDVVDKKLNKELSLGRLMGPLEIPPFEDFVISPLGIRAKKAPGEYRVIHDLSFPYDGNSINDGIPRDQATVKYASVYDAIKAILKFGHNTFLAKTDIRSAFRIIPIAPSNYHLLGFKWRNKYYFDKCLPMGASSSCAIFESLSTALEWILLKYTRNVLIVHVLDDFLIISPNEQLCELALKQVTEICEQIGIPLAPEKTMGPSHCLPFLGIELDTERMLAFLPQDKVDKFLNLINQFLESKSVTLKSLQSLTGMLNFACQIILPARAFSRRLYNLEIGVSKSYYKIKMTKEVKSDLLVWKNFLENYNYQTFFLESIWLSNDVLQLHTDAAGSIGFAAIFQSHWLADVWDESCKKLNITILELYPIFLAIHIWAHELSNKCLHIYTDNQAVSYILNSFTSKEANCMILIRKLVKICMDYNILIKSTHLSGIHNKLADLLSRQRIAEARVLKPQLEQCPTSVPAELQLQKLLLG